jgi:hypothetical protein
LNLIGIEESEAIIGGEMKYIKSRITNTYMIVRKLNQLNEKFYGANKTAIIIALFGLISTLVSGGLVYKCEGIRQTQNAKREIYLEFSKFQYQLLELYEEYFQAKIECSYYHVLCLNPRSSKAENVGKNSELVDGYSQKQKNIAKKIKEKNNELFTNLTSVKFYFSQTKEVKNLITKILNLRPKWIGFPIPNNSKIRNHKQLLKWKKETVDKLNEYLTKYYREPFNSLLSHLKADI